MEINGHAEVVALKLAAMALDKLDESSSVADIAAVAQVYATIDLAAEVSRIPGAL